MSEDVSATMRVGITVILVAALVATVLNLMVMSNSLLSGGQTTLQSGIDSVSQQEFSTYNNTKVSGTQVNTALSLFQGRDVAVIVQTKTFKENYCPRSDQGEGFYMNYGAIISASSGSSVQPVSADTAGGLSNKLNTPSNSPFTDTAVQTIAGSTSGKYFIVNVGTAKIDSTKTVVATQATSAQTQFGYAEQKPGAPNLTALLWDKNGIVQTNSNIIGCSTLGNPQYLLSSARFQSCLIKDATGSIIGICFYQIN